MMTMKMKQAMSMKRMKEMMKRRKHLIHNNSHDLKNYMSQKASRHKRCQEQRQ
jgi:hypothetical protein